MTSKCRGTSRKMSLGSTGGLWPGLVGGAAPLSEKGDDQVGGRWRVRAGAGLALSKGPRQHEAGVGSCGKEVARPHVEGLGGRWGADRGA